MMGVAHPVISASRLTFVAVLDLVDKYLGWLKASGI